MSQDAPEELAMIRRQVLDTWGIERYAFPPKMEQMLLSLWDEIVWAESGGAWTALTTLTGRLAEGVLKVELSARGEPEARVNRATLGRLLRTAEQIGALAPGSMSLGARGLSQHVRRLRNLGAHFSMQA